MNPFHEARGKQEEQQQEYRTEQGQILHFAAAAGREEGKGGAE